MKVSIPLDASEAVAKTKQSPLQKAYRKFFNSKVKASGKEHPFQGSKSEIADFMLDVSEGWAAHKKQNGL